MKKQIWCTLGPSSLNDRVIERLEEMGVNLFRINLSHTAIEVTHSTLEYIQSRTKVPVCLDTEGAQVRTGNFNQSKIELKENRTIMITGKKVAEGDMAQLTYEATVDKKSLKEAMPGSWYSRGTHSQSS